VKAAFLLRSSSIDSPLSCSGGFSSLLRDARGIRSDKKLGINRGCLGRFDSDRSLLREVDWARLLFFVGMFVVTGSVLASGDIEAMLGLLMGHLGRDDARRGELDAHLPTAS
jgi:hypothetical protein